MLVLPDNEFVFTYDPEVLSSERSCLDSLVVLGSKSLGRDGGHYYDWLGCDMLYQCWAEAYSCEFKDIQLKSEVKKIIVHFQGYGKKTRSKMVTPAVPFVHHQDAPGNHITDRS